jgi:hypothetical protein
LVVLVDTDFFDQLKLFIDELDEEERRGVREGLNKEELAIFDLPCQGIELSENREGRSQSHRQTTA